MAHPASELEEIPYTKFEKSRNTGEWRFKVPLLDEEACILCHQCIDFCPDVAIQAADDGAEYVVVDYDFCKGCGICEDVCPVDAFRMEVE